MTKAYKFLTLPVLFALVLGAGSCRKNFGEINTNPSVVITPDIGFLLTYAEDKIVTYQYTEWIWESMEQLMRFTQHLKTITHSEHPASPACKSNYALHHRTEARDRTAPKIISK